MTEEKLPLSSLPEYNMPNFLNLFLPYNIIPLIVYSLIFRLARQYVKTHFWLKFEGFKRYRLQNLTICWAHAVVVGLGDLVLMFSHPHEIFHEVIEWYDPIAAQLPLISVAYFFQDAIDMLMYEWSSYTLELLLHHFATCAALVCPGVTGRFTLAAGWALLMEVNSIFLHARTILQICGLNTQFPGVFRFVVYSNIISFFFFRIVSQLLWTHWAIYNVPGLHWYFEMIGLLGPVVFGCINGLLFMRLLASDGFLPESLRAKFMVTRDKNDDQDKEKKKTT
ncbi:hypothetical protein CRE_13518 [Caenorhabditis remanei]|uniref:Uncharacterized protein n=1 Tax=Caenorhabditis remanei TaxID=31234 RepID=E3MR31_CAERE|nr:hypothetical protein CRE_13518 [Caenorhabditis remanei]